MIEPTPLPPTTWYFPPTSDADDYGVVGVGADLEPPTLIHAYRHGLFPMPADEEGDLIAWWSPPERGVLGLDDLKISRSLRRSCRRYEVSINGDFRRVIETCASLPRDGGWIAPSIVEAYCRLHELGWAHSVETWLDGELVGGLYGVQVHGLFAGESMFHRATDASKVALVALVRSLQRCGAELLDVQWATDHLASLGVQAIPRASYLERLERALLCPALSLGQLSSRNSSEKTLKYLDRIVWEPTGGSHTVTHRSST